jgi:hypothetical protein
VTVRERSAPNIVSRLTWSRDHAPAILDRWRPWFAFEAVLMLITYGPSGAHLIATTPLNTPAFVSGERWAASGHRR